MRKLIPLVVFAVAVAALSGCSTGSLPGGASAGGSVAAPSSAGSGSAAGSDTSAKSGSTCATARAALAKVVTGSLSQPYQRADTCNFGVGPNASLSGPALGALYSNAVVVKFDAADADNSNYQAALDAYADSKPLSGVGTAAQYYDGGNGDPQVFARTATSFCLVQTTINDATQVGLSKPGGSRNIAAADVPKLASELGGVCTALFGN
jgi:hypothetical protein